MQSPVVYPPRACVLDPQISLVQLCVRRGADAFLVKPLGTGEVQHIWQFVKALTPVSAPEPDEAVSAAGQPTWQPCPAGGSRPRMAAVDDSEGGSSSVLVCAGAAWNVPSASGAGGDGAETCTGDAPADAPADAEDAQRSVPTAVAASMAAASNPAPAPAPVARVVLPPMPPHASEGRAPNPPSSTADSAAAPGGGPADTGRHGRHQRSSGEAAVCVDDEANVAANCQQQ